MKYILIALMIPLTLILSAQDAGTLKNVQKYPNKKWRVKLKIAKKKIAEGSYYNAAQYLEDVYKEKPEKIQVPHLLGDVNRILRDYEAAEKYYKAVIEKDPEAYVNDQFYLGQMQKMNGRYEEAKKTLTEYLKVKLGKKETNYKKLADIEIAGCDTALALLKTPTKIKVEKTEGSVNTTLMDASPKPLKGNRILYASQKTDTAVNITVSKDNHYSSIFMAEKSGKIYTNKTELPSPPNSAKGSTSNAVFNADESTLVFTVCADSLDLGNRLKCKLYRSTKKSETEWNEPEELKALNPEIGTATHPAFGVDANGAEILYYASDKPTGKGGLDIYYSKVNSDGTFAAGESIGDLNTIGDDMTPFYDRKNKVLYFSSNGHPSIGGLDVFKVSGTPGNWGAVANAGIPINSSADDLYLALDEKGFKGFMVSNRLGTTSPRGATCCDDIWTVIVKQDVVLKAVYVKRGDVTNTPVTGVDASLYKVAGNNFEFVGNAITTPDPFTFTLTRNTSYKINGNKEGYWPTIDNLTVSEDEERDTIEAVFYIDPIIKIKVKIPNVYFAFDKSNVIAFYKGQIDSVVKILSEHPGYSVEIQGHTDNKGTDEYNQKLSERRAKEVKTFLVKKKSIADNRIVVKTFGETVPAVPNELPNGEDDPEGRARNRRVEFKIITDKPEDAPEFESVGEVVKEVKTGPGFTTKKK